MSGDMMKTCSCMSVTPRSVVSIAPRAVFRLGTWPMLGRSRFRRAAIVANGGALVSTAARLMVECLENEGVAIVFGLPGEENIRFVQALAASNIRYILTRHEQGAAFMAEMYGRVTGRAAVVSATLGPGAINMQLGVAD